MHLLEKDGEGVVYQHIAQHQCAQEQVAVLPKGVDLPSILTLLRRPDLVSFIY